MGCDCALLPLYEGANESDYTERMNSIAREFWARMDAAEQKLSAITEEKAKHPFRAEGWTRKEILGH